VIDGDLLASLIQPGYRVALADGAGLPLAVLPALTDAARRAGDIELFLGWCMSPLEGLDPSVFRSVVAIMGGYGLRRSIDAGAIHYLPARLGTVPSLLHTTLRPDVFITSVTECSDGYRFTTEASWFSAAVSSGATIAAVVRTAAPSGAAGAALAADRVTIIGTDDSAPIEVPQSAITDAHRAIGKTVASLVAEGGRVQFGPGGIGACFVDALDRPVRVDSGLLSDGVVTLDQRGLLLGQPMGTYAAGTARLYEWLDGRPVLHPIEVTHDPGRLAVGSPFFAVNTALQIDLDGQINVEASRGSVVAGIGGNPDFAAAATTNIGGLSILALPTVHAGRPTLVERLDAPVSTASHDIDVVVTELGWVDLRGLDRPQRRAALRTCWPA
jgi:acyl-CoA hydrolase